MTEINLFPTEQSLHDVAPIVVSAGQLVTGREALEGLIEEPARDAVVDLYDKNIRTVSASANSKDPYSAYIDIDPSSLSDENRSIAHTIGSPIEDQDGVVRVVKLHIQYEDIPTVRQVSDDLKHLTEQFRPQELTWAPVYGMEDLKRMYGYTPEDIVDPGDFVGEGYFYDEETQRFYLSEEIFHKMKNPQAEMPRD